MTALLLAVFLVASCGQHPTPPTTPTPVVMPKLVDNWQTLP